MKLDDDEVDVLTVDEEVDGAVDDHEQLGERAEEQHPEGQAQAAPSSCSRCTPRWWTPDIKLIINYVM